MSRLLVLFTGAILTTAVSGQDAVQTDGDKYKVILENECVRVLDYQDESGDQTSEHRHPPFVLYALNSFERTITLPNGKVLNREFKPGEVMWSDAQTHVGKNVGDTATHVVIVELKGDGTDTEKCIGK